MKLSYLMLDLSGVPVVDTMVANVLIKVYQALKVIGIKAILCGIRPDLAKKLVQRDVQFTSIDTFSSLYRAIQHID
ncbi:STAS domain-containing protein [Amphibacillus jilinensis]|uniref:STAS domain-containing protein n=1 Tax=Amphibacillus jilinensis TaxID=1216008 RepID=UPI0013758D65|nr:STAS domain-containing protein [Amphibacillus jilinensis]